MTKILILVLLVILTTTTTIIVDADLVRLGYDDGSAEDGVWMDNLRGHAVVFEAPCDNWTLSEVEILGKLAPEPESEMFVVEVWDRTCPCSPSQWTGQDRSSTTTLLGR